MKTIRPFFVVFAIAAVASVCLALIDSPAVENTEADTGKGFAVIELFTSEGCSSCPPADELLARVQKENAGKPVYILAYHVDYWNRLGWKDIFSKAEFSHRQSVYSVWLRVKGVYTPQAVVNGKTEFVGSAQGTLHNAVNAGLKQDAKAELSLSNVMVNGHNATLKYVAGGNTSNTTLQVALVQKNAVNQVKSGENRGRTLSHIQIVRDLKSIPLGKNNNGETSIDLPASFAAQDYELIAFLQNTASGEITAATRAALPAPATASN